MSYAIWGMMNAVWLSIEFLAGISWVQVGVIVSLAVVTYLILHPSLFFAFAGTRIREVDPKFKTTAALFLDIAGVAF